MNQFNKLRRLLAGKKTYIIGTLMVLIAVEKYLSGTTTLSQFLTTVQGLTGFNGLAFIAMRAGVAKNNPTK